MNIFLSGFRIRKFKKNAALISQATKRAFMYNSYILKKKGRISQEVHTEMVLSLLLSLLKFSYIAWWWSIWTETCSLICRLSLHNKWTIVSIGDIL